MGNSKEHITNLIPKYGEEQKGKDRLCTLEGLISANTDCFPLVFVSVLLAFSRLKTKYFADN